MAFVITGDLNQAHDQALALWKKIGEKQERNLLVFSEKVASLGATLKYWGDHTLSEKCRLERGTGLLFGEELLEGKVGVTAWNGSIRITGVVAFYAETHSGTDTKFNPDVRAFAREIAVFKCYSLVSRAGRNICHVAANTYGGAWNAGQAFPFDYSRLDGGLDLNKMRGPFGLPAMSLADLKLRDVEIATELSAYSKDCYHIPEAQEREWMSASCTTWDGRRLEVAGKITGRHDCFTDMEMRQAV